MPKESIKINNYMAKKVGPTIERRNFEAEFTTKLSKWLEYNAEAIANEIGYQNLGPIEVKVSYEKRFNFKSGFKKHQISNLIAVKKGTVCYKIPDFDRTLQKPWDLDCYVKSMSVIAIQWYRRNNRVFYLIDPEKLQEFIKSGRKSLTEADASMICFKIGYIQLK